MPVNIDYKFISELEGGSKTSGYVPAVGISRSGVTIATGFDLGACNENDLKKLKLSSQLVNILKPYLGLKGKNAQDKLKEKQLILTKEECQKIDKAVKAAHIQKLQLKYNSAAGNKVKFDDLPSQAQTVIASVSFQYGVGLDIRAPKFWKAVTSQNWTNAVKVLKSFGDVYPTRRNKEALLLEKIQ